MSKSVPVPERYKRPCWRCGIRIAVWADASNASDERMFCDNCVPRGCVCTESTGLDHKGRRWPCIEMFNCPEGFEDEF
jgi:hypothetical protein